MAKVTPKENFLMLAHGGHPEYVPVYTMMGVPYMGEVADVMMMAPVFKSSAFVDGGTDEWGVRYVAAEGTNRATMPDTSIVMLEDIEDWAKVIKFPEPNEVDFEKTYEQQLKQFNIDRNRSAVKCGPGFQPFQELVAIMGFTGGLMALASDPEEVKAMLNAMVDHIEPYFEKTLDYYKPDLWMMGDDTCTKLAPFFSPETYKDVFLPIYHRMADPAVERGIPVEFHICGYCEPFMDFMVDFGVQMIDPVQASNDIVKCKEKYKGKLSFMGGWGHHGQVRARRSLRVLPQRPCELFRRPGRGGVQEDRTGRGALVRPEDLRLYGGISPRKLSGYPADTKKVRYRFGISLFS